MLYEEYGFVSPLGGVAQSADEAVRIAERVGYPVVMKVVSPDVLHKLDVGGVLLNVSGEGQVRIAYRQIVDQVAEGVPGARIKGVTVEEMCETGVEIIVGLQNDRQFGPVIMFGLGGIFTEVLDDVSFRVLPITEHDARSMMAEIKGQALLRGYRGQPAANEDTLVHLLMQANHMGLDLADRLGSVDFNPIIVWGDQHRVLDFKLLLEDDPARGVRELPNTQDLELFFGARAVAVIGASASPGKVGNVLLDSLAKHDYPGAVYPINPKRREIMGLPTYSDLAAVPTDAELAVVVVDLRAAPDLIDQWADRGGRAMVIISGGGKELGGDTVDVEARIREASRERGVRVVGPNCIGVFDGETRLDTLFQDHERLLRPPAGPVAMITQSGTVGIAFLEAATFGISRFVSYGNRADVDEADLLAFLAEDAATRVIACYVEGFEHGRKFLEAARAVAAHKPVIIYKGGRSRQGARAAMSHTGFWGGSYRICQGAFRQAGLIDVDSIEELAAAAKALAMQPEARGPRVAMLSNGAGTMVQALDLLAEYGLVLAHLEDGTVQALADAYPGYYVVQNPLDLTGSSSSADYRFGIEQLLADCNVDIVMPWFVMSDTPLDEGILQVMSDLATTSPKPILGGAIGGPYTERMARAMDGSGAPVFRGVREWVAAARAAAARALMAR